MKIRKLLPLCLAALACGTPPEILPPPFGPDGPSPTRLFFPTGLVTLSDGSLLVANGNTNRQYDAGTLVTIRKSYLDGFFAKALSCQSVNPPEETVSFTDNPCDDDVSKHPGDVFGGVVLTGNYAGPMALNPAGDVAFAASRDTSVLHAVHIQPDLSLTCIPGGGTSPDCRQGIVDLGAQGVFSPYSVVAGDFQPPGRPAQPVLYVSAMSPRIDDISNGILDTTALVAAVDVNNPSQVLFTLTAGSAFDPSVGTGVGPTVYDPVRHQLVMSGCFQRFPGGGAGEPGTGQCTFTNNFLRFLSVDAQSSALVHLFDLFGDVPSLETTAMEIGGGDVATLTPPTTIWATMRNPDVLVEIDLPAAPSLPPRVRHVTQLPISPADVIRIARPGRSDLIAVVAEKAGSIIFYDAGLELIVGAVDRLGDSPFSTRILSNDGTTARLATTVFRGCRVALTEVPLDAPWQAQLRGRVGRCP